MAVAALLLYVMTAARQAIARPNIRFGQFFLRFFADPEALGRSMVKSNES